MIRDSREGTDRESRIKVNFIQIFAEEEILNVISILYPKEILKINGKNFMFHDLGISLHGKTDIPYGVFHYMEKLIYPMNHGVFQF